MSEEPLEGELVGQVYPQAFYLPVEATEEQREEVMYLMRERNYTWSQIAEHCGYPSASVVKQIYRRRVTAAANDHSGFLAKEHLSVLISQLDSMLQPLWPAIDEGDVPSINAGRQLVMDKARLMGLTEKQEAVGAQGSTVIISSESMLATMAEHLQAESRGAA